MILNRNEDKIKYLEDNYTKGSSKFKNHFTEKKINNYNLTKGKNLEELQNWQNGTEEK